MSPGAIPSSVLKAAEAAVCLRADQLRIVLRAPLDVQSNSLYDLWAGERHLIVKEYLKPDEWDDAPRREFGALQRLAGTELAPAPVFYDPVFGPTVVYEFMGGDMWDRRVPSPAELTQLATLWLHLHSLPTEGLWFSRGQDQTTAAMSGMIVRSLHRYSTWAATKYPPGRRFVQFFPRMLAQFDAAQARLAELETPLCFCRGDARFANVISRPDGRLGLVDWEDCGLRDPARDLGDLLTHPNQEDLLSFADWQHFLDPYLAVRERVDPAIHRRLEQYLALFPIFWLAILINVGIERATAGTIHAWRINGLPKNVQLRRYLARVLSWPGVDVKDALADLGEITFFPEQNHGR